MAPNGSDVVVVGAGVVGAAVAAQLVEDGWKVSVVYDPAVPGASAASGAMLGALAETTPGEPESDLLLRLDSASRYPAWLESIGCDVGRGTFVVGNARRATDLHGVRAIEQAASRHGAPCERVDPTDVPGLTPAPGWSPATVLHLPEEGWVDPNHLIDALLMRVTRTLGARVQPGRVVALDQRGGRVTGVVTGDGARHPCDHVVLCCGASAEAILQESGLGERGVMPALLRSKGVGVDLRASSSALDETFPAVVRTPNREFACGLHVVPRGRDTVYVGATNRVSRFAEVLGGVTAGEVSLLLSDALSEISTSLSSWDVVRTTSGFRSLVSDGTPAVGRTAVDGLSLAVGTYRNGVLLAPLLAWQVAGELAERVGPHSRMTPRREVSTPAAAPLLRAGLADLAAQLQDERDPGWSAKLAPILYALAAVAFGDELEAAKIRAGAYRVLERYGRPEVVPEVMIEILQAIPPIDDLDRSV